MAAVAAGGGSPSTISIDPAVGALAPEQRRKFFSKLPRVVMAQVGAMSLGDGAMVAACLQRARSRVDTDEDDRPKNKVDVLIAQLAYEKYSAMLSSNTDFPGHTHAMQELFGKKPTGRHSALRFLHRFELALARLGKEGVSCVPPEDFEGEVYLPEEDTEGKIYCPDDDQGKRFLKEYAVTYQKLAGHGQIRRILAFDEGATPTPDEIIARFSEKSGELNRSVRVLDLREMDLSFLPAIVGRLYGVNRLYLSKNPLGNLPDFVKDMWGLEHLAISGTQLQSFPPVIKQLSKLKVLILNNNGLTELPKDMGFLGHLETLSLCRNQINEFPYHLLSGVRDIKYLHLSNNPLEVKLSELVPRFRYGRVTRLTLLASQLIEDRDATPEDIHLLKWLAGLSGEGCIIEKPVYR